MRPVAVLAAAVSISSCGCSTTCKCSTGGVETAQFPQADTCKSNVMTTLQTSCGVPSP
jgi:hypothetical protein